MPTTTMTTAGLQAPLGIFAWLQQHRRPLRSRVDDDG